VIEASHWLRISMFFFILLGIFIWIIYGKVAMNISARGIIMPEDQMLLAEKFFNEDINGKEVILNSTKQLLDKKKLLYKKHYLSYVDLQQAEKEYLMAKEDSASSLYMSYFNMDRTLFKQDHTAHDQPLEALVFVNYTQGKKVAAGMKAYLLPSMISAYEYGYIKGIVSSVSRYPISKELAYSYFGNMNLVDDFFSQGVPFLVKIHLERNQNTLSHLSWTTKQGTPFTIDAGSAVSVKIVQHECSPLGLLTRLCND
jgi:hypothetical protein